MAGGVEFRCELIDRSIRVTKGDGSWFTADEVKRVTGALHNTGPTDVPELRFSCDNCNGADLPTLAVRSHGRGQVDGRADGLRDASEMVRERALSIVEAMGKGPIAPGVGFDALRYCRDVLAALGVAIGRKAELMDGDPACQCGHPRSEHVNGFDRVADCGRELEAGFCACAQFRPATPEVP